MRRVVYVYKWVTPELHLLTPLYLSNQENSFKHEHLCASFETSEADRYPPAIAGDYVRWLLEFVQAMKEAR